MRQRRRITSSWLCASNSGRLNSAVSQLTSKALVRRVWEGVERGELRDESKLLTSHSSAQCITGRYVIVRDVAHPAQPLAVSHSTERPRR